MKTLIFITSLLSAAWILPEVYFIVVVFNKLTAVFSLI